MQLKTLVRYPIDIKRARRLLSERQLIAPPLSERPIALDLRTPQLLFDCGRHLASLAHYATCAGSPFYVRCRQMLLAGIARKIHGRELLALSHASWIPQALTLPADALVLSDYQAPSSDRYVRMMIGRDVDRSIPVMPYPMHPATLRAHSQADIIGLRQGRSRSSIFFAGNQKPKYGDAKIQRNFGVLSRLEILRTLAAQFRSRLASSMDSATGTSMDSATGKSMDSATGKSMDSATGKMPIVISDSRIESISADDWLPTLATAQFFVCCPGSSQPTCHNLVEAMSVGTIPIIEYGDRLTPQLRDGENAICFRGKAGLVEAIERIDRLTPDRILQMAKNAATYYDAHLCGTRFLTQLRDGKLDLTSQRVCMPFHERNFYASDRAAA